MRLLSAIMILLLGLSANAVSAASTPTTPHRNTASVQLHPSTDYAPQAKRQPIAAWRNVRRHEDKAIVEPLALFAAALTISATVALFAWSAAGYFLLANFVGLFMGIIAHIRAKRLGRRGRRWANFAIIWGSVSIILLFAWVLAWTYG